MAGNSASSGYVESPDSSRSPLATAASGNGGPLRLEERARQVEDEANRELERLVPLLDLTEEQQERVFEKLAQNSVHWGTGLSTGGSAPSSSGTPANAAATPDSGTPSTTQSLSDLLTAPDSVLTAEQEQKLLTDDLERREWWDEVLSQLQADIAAGPDPVAAAPAVPPLPALEGGTPPVIQAPLPDTAVEGAESVVD